MMNNNIGGFKNCTYIYVNLTYYESLKSSINFSSVELFNTRGGNFKDFLLFLMCIIYVGSGSSHRKLSHCALSQALNHNKNKKPQKDPNENGKEIRQLQLQNLSPFS